MTLLTNPYSERDVVNLAGPYPPYANPGYLERIYRETQIAEARREAAQIVRDGLYALYPSLDPAFAPKRNRGLRPGVVDLVARRGELTRLAAVLDASARWSA